MSTIVQVENLSKRYFIQRSDVWYVSFREALMATMKQWGEKICFQDPIPPPHQQEEFWALQDVSFTVEKGDAIGILGKNGAGKSTLLKLLSRVTAPTKGSITLQGTVSSLLEVGIGFHAELTARENIFFNGALMGMSRDAIRRNFDSIVDFSGVAPFLDTPMKKFSSGMSARLGFAIGAHLYSDIFIVDEVLAVGDADFQKKCIQKMRSLLGEGRTLFFVSHDINTLLTLCNKGIVLEKGRAIATGSITTCANQYLSSAEKRGLSWDGVLGDSLLRLYHASLTSAKERDVDFFLPHEHVSLHIEFAMEKPRSDIVLTMRIRNAHNCVIAESRWCDGKETPLLTSERQRIEFPLAMPLFHPGEYTISFEATLHNQKILFHDEALLHFTLHSDTIQEHLGNLEGGISLGNRWIPQTPPHHVEESVQDTTRQREKVGVREAR